MACSIVSDLVVGFSSLIRVEVLGGRDHFMVGCKPERVCWLTLSGLCPCPTYTHTEPSNLVVSLHFA